MAKKDSVGDFNFGHNAQPKKSGGKPKAKKGKNKGKAKKGNKNAWQSYMEGA